MFPIPFRNQAWMRRIDQKLWTAPILFQVPRSKKEKPLKESDLLNKTLKLLKTAVFFVAVATVLEPIVSLASEQGEPEDLFSEGSFEEIGDNTPNSSEQIPTYPNENTSELKSESTTAKKSKYIKYYWKPDENAVKYKGLYQFQGKTYNFVVSSPFLMVPEKIRFKRLFSIDHHENSSLVYDESIIVGKYVKRVYTLEKESSVAYEPELPPEPEPVIITEDVYLSESESEEAKRSQQIKEEKATQYGVRNHRLSAGFGFAATEFEGKTLGIDYTTENDTYDYQLRISTEVFQGENHLFIVGAHFRSLTFKIKNNEGRIETLMRKVMGFQIGHKFTLGLPFLTSVSPSLSFGGITVPQLKEITVDILENKDAVLQNTDSSFIGIGVEVDSAIGDHTLRTNIEVMPSLTDGEGSQTYLGFNYLFPVYDNKINLGPTLFYESTNYKSENTCSNVGVNCSDESETSLSVISIGASVLGSL